MAQNIQKINKTVNVDSLDVFDTYTPVPHVPMMWVGGKNGSGSPQLKKHSAETGNQVARRAAYCMYYGFDLPKNSYNNIFVVSGKTSNGKYYSKNDINPYHMVLRRSHNGKIEYLDVSDESTIAAARRKIINFIK